jgi:uncharacterized protein (UPF0332 family)
MKKKPDWKEWIEDKKECKEWLDSYIKREVIIKSTDESKLFLKKADHNLNFANWIVEQHNKEIPNFFGKETFYDWTINIYYYAIYHATLALVSKKGYRSKSHTATLAFIISNYYHTQQSLSKEDIELVASSLSKEDIETIGFSKELREKASYDVHESFEKELALNTQKQAADFVNKIKTIINK